MLTLPRNVLRLHLLLCVSLFSLYLYKFFSVLFVSQLILVWFPFKVEASSQLAARTVILHSRINWYASQHYLHWLLKYLLRLLNQPLLQIYWDCVGFLDGSDAIT